MNTNQHSADSILENVFAGVAQPQNAHAVDTLLDKFGLNWTVSKQPLQLPDGRPTPFYGIVRDDNGHTFSTCKDSYTPYQNSELAEMLIRISERTGYTAHTGGQFNGGAKVFIQLDSPNKIEGIGANRDTVRGYLTGINSHDGSTALKWGETNITISCKNTFMSTLKQIKSSARHTASIHDRVEQAIRELSGLVLEEKNLFDQFIKLSEQPVTRERIAKVVKGVTDVDILDVNYKNGQYSAYAMNRTQELLASIAQEMAQKGETLWGLHSGVTHYTTHKMPVPSRENARLESIYTGTGYEINNRAFALVLA